FTGPFVVSMRPYTPQDAQRAAEITEKYPMAHGGPIQIGDPDQNAAAIDPLADGLDLSPVYDLLFDPNILKIFHAARQDLEIIFNLTGKVVHPFFDTQIAAMVCGYGDSIGYEALVRNITGGTLDKSVQYTNWAHRPLSAKQIDYALGDVTHLVGVYAHLSAELEARGRTSWVYEEEAILEDPATYAVAPLEMWKKVKVKSPKPKTLAVLRALAAWREARAQRKDIPRNWVMRDDTLADLAGQIPRDAKGLKKIRNMSGDMAEGRLGKALLEVIEGALDSDPADWPEAEKRKPLPAKIAARVEVLKLLLKLQAAEHGVATKLIASSDDLEELAKDDGADIPALHGWRYEIFGADAIDFKNGKVAIGMKGNKVAKFAINAENGVAQ
ncbi:MAG: ribonuclease D, partial [Bdellovibrionales bacterium]